MQGLTINSQSRWRPVTGFGDSYEVSDFGEVRRIKPVKGGVLGHLLNQSEDRHGYLYATLSHLGRSRKRPIHQLVCEAFYRKKPTPKHEPNHLDGDPKNNHYKNLKWATRSENNLHKCRVLGKGIGKNHPFYGLTGEKSKSAKAFILTSPEGVNIHVVGLKQFCRINGLTDANLYKVLQGKISHSKGWKIRRP